MQLYNNIISFMVFLLFYLKLFACELLYDYDKPINYVSNYSMRENRSIMLNNIDELTANYWNKEAQSKLKEHLSRTRNKNIAKNVILFLGDGMSFTTIAASRIYLGQANGKTGEETKFMFEDFPDIGLSKTYCVDKQVADSACSATAYLSGVKGNYKTIGVTANVKYNDCLESEYKKYYSTPVTELAIDAGKNVGIVTTTTITHASPAGAYAHTANRERECDNDTLAYGCDPTLSSDIAKQLVLDSPGKNFKVLFGGGRSKFLPNTEKDEEGASGERLDKLNLIEKWKEIHPNGKYIYNKAGLKSLNTSNVDYVLGLFEPQHLLYNLDMDKEKKPTLKEMTVAALEILSKDKPGYFLFVEGGRIDMAHHESKAHKALDETVQFSEAIEAAIKMIDLNETLVIVTADHSHTMTLAGYSNRGDSILGAGTQKSDIDHLLYTTLAYANGPGYKNINRTQLLRSLKTGNKDYEYAGLVPMIKETHGGEDVPVYANGPWSHLFTGSYEQNTIPHLISYAACYGKGLTVCNHN